MTESCKISELLPNPYNRELDPEKVENIKAEIKRTGEIRPLVYSEVDNDGKPGKMVTDGHHRFKALKDLGYTEVPVVLSDKRGLDTKAPKAEVEKRRSTAGLNNAKEGRSWIRHEDNWVLYTGDNRKVGESETLDGIRTQQRMLEYVEDIQVSDEDVEKVVRHEGSKWVVRSHKGKSLGSYSSKEGAVNRLRQVEYFKHNKMSQDEFKEEVRDLAKSWFGDPERHAEAAKHDGLKLAIKVAAVTALAAGGLVALRSPTVRGIIARQAERILTAFPKSKVVAEEIAMPHGAPPLPKGFKPNWGYSDIFRNAAYQKFEKNKVAEYVNMSPSEYLERAAKGFKMTPEALIASRTNNFSTPLVNKYAKMFKQGSKAETLVLDHTDGFSQEGIHRAMAAKKIGLAQVPVVVVKPAVYTPKEKFLYYKENKPMSGQAESHAAAHGLHPKTGTPLENQALNLRVHPNKEVLVYKNPTQANINDLNRTYKEKYPNAPLGDPKIRTTIGSDGNTYSWMSGHATHSEVEPALESLTGIKHSQNPFLLDTGITATAEAPLKTALGRKELAEEATHQFGEVRDFDWEANKKILWNPVFRDTGLSHDVLKEVVSHGANPDRRMGVRILYNARNGNFLLGPWGVEHEEIFNQAIANKLIPANSVLDKQWSRMRYDVGKKGALPQFDTEDSLHLHSWEHSELTPRSSFLSTMKSILSHKEEFPDSLKAEFMDSGKHYGGMQTLGEWRAAAKKGLFTNDIAKSMAKAWFGEPERHAEVAAGHGTGLAGSQSKAALHTNLKNAIAIVAGGAILAGGIIALRNPAVLASIANAAKYAMGKFPASKVATEAYDATVAAGGHTVSLAGKIPEARYMFSPYKANERIIPMKNLAASHIDSYIRDNKALLSQSNHHLGTWHNTETGNVHLDVSLPHHDRTAALLDAQKHKQLAIYDRLHNKDIPVNEQSIAQAKMIDSLKQTMKEKRENWHSGEIKGGFGHDVLHEVSLATKGHADAHELKILYNHQNGNYVVASPFWSHDQLLDAVQPALPGKLDAPWIRMSYDTQPKSATGHLNMWDWFTHSEQEKGSPGEHYAKAFGRVLQNKDFPDHMTFNYHEPFRQLLSSKPLKEWRHSYGVTSKDMETGDIMKAEKEIDRAAMVAAERAEHPTLEDKIVQQIAADHIKAGKDLLYKMGVEAAQKSVTRHPRPVPVNEPTPAIPKDATHPKVLYTVTLPAKMTKQEVLAKVQDLVKVYRGLPKETDAQANTQASIEQMQTIDQTLVDMHGSIQELEALARDQQLLSDEEVNLIIQPLKDKISLLLNVLENGTLEESEEVSQNTPEESAIASDPQRQRKKPYGPKRVGDATAERELTEPATTFADKADSEQDISKGFFGFGGGNRGWHGDPEGHAEAARERWEVANRGKPGGEKPGVHGAIAHIAVKAARHTGNRIARVAGEAIADIGLATFGAVAGVMILSHLKGTPIPMIQAGKLGLTHLKSALETSFKAAQITSLKNEVKLARLKLWLNNPGAKLSSGVSEAAKIAAEAKAASKPIQIIKPAGEKFSTIKPSIKTKPKNKIK